MYTANYEYNCCLMQSKFVCFPVVIYHFLPRRRLCAQERGL
jgi:hypothetical protein